MGSLRTSCGVTHGRDKDESDRALLLHMSAGCCHHMCNSPCNHRCHNNQHLCKWMGKSCNPSPLLPYKYGPPLSQDLQRWPKTCLGKDLPHHMSLLRSCTLHCNPDSRLRESKILLALGHRLAWHTSLSERCLRIWSFYMPWRLPMARRSGTCNPFRCIGDMWDGHRPP